MSSSIPRTSGIYKITCIPTGKIYVGSAVNLYVRRVEHFSQLRHQKHRNLYLQRAWNKYGENAFEFSVIELVLIPFLIEREQYWLDKLKTYDRRNGFNIFKTANSSLGHTFSFEFRQKVSDGLRGKQKTEEHRQKLSEANRGKKASLETRKKLSKARKGQPHSKEHSQNIGKALAGRKRSAQAMRGILGVHAKEWVVIDPDGVERTIVSMMAFCQERGLSHACMYLVAQGRQAHHRGWKCRYADQPQDYSPSAAHLADGSGFIDLNGATKR